MHSLKTARFTVFLFFSFLTLSCGEDSSTSAEELAEEASDTETPESLSGTTGPTARVLLSGEDKPDCGEENKGALLYLLDSSKFQYCSGSSWTDIDLKGDAGKKGDQGSAGEKGAAGAKGDSGMKASAVYSYHTTGSLPSSRDLLSDSTIFMAIISDIEVVTFSSGGGFLSLSGVIKGVDTGLDTYNDSFSWSQIIPDKKGQQSFTFKAFMGSHTSIRASLDLATPATILLDGDQDGDYSDTTAQTYTLIKQ